LLFFVIDLGADVLTYATDILPERVDWLVALQEIRARSGSVFARQSLRNIPLRQTRIASPGPNESLQPGDHVIVIATSDKVSQLKCGMS